MDISAVEEDEHDVSNSPSHAPISTAPSSQSVPASLDPASLPISTSTARQPISSSPVSASQSTSTLDPTPTGSQPTSGTTTSSSQCVSTSAQAQELLSQVQGCDIPHPELPQSSALDSEDEFDMALQLQDIGLPDVSELNELTSADLDSCMTYDNPVTQRPGHGQVLTAASTFVAAFQSISQPVTAVQFQSSSQPTTATSVPVITPQSASQPAPALDPQLVWVKIRGFPMWPARITKELTNNMVRIIIFDKKETVMDVDLLDTKPFCKSENLEKKISIPAKYKADWSSGYEKCLNIFLEITN